MSKVTGPVAVFVYLIHLVHPERSASILSNADWHMLSPQFAITPACLLSLIVIDKCVYVGYMEVILVLTKDQTLRGRAFHSNLIGPTNEKPIINI